MKGNTKQRGRDAGRATIDPPSVEVLFRLSGEISTKGRRARSRFQRILVKNLRDACESTGRPCAVRDEWSRLFVSVPALVPDDALQRVFGVSTYSPVAGTCSADLPEIVRAGARLYGEAVKGRRYAVRARRSGHHGFSSQDIMTELGGALNEGAEVDLSDPEIEVWVEVRDHRAFFFSERVRAAGGLPLGAQGRAVALLSGGFDSAVAAWMMLRRGVVLDYVFCNLGGEAYKRLVVEVAKALADRWSYGTRPTLYVLHFGPVVEELKERVRPSLHQLVLKRQMYRAAARVASGLSADAIVTGEAVGQVSSQTLRNLRALEDASSLPVLRPLVGMDKEEIIARSRTIGTYALSARVREYCALGSGRPATAARPRTVLRDDRLLEPALIATVADEAEALDLRALDVAELAGATVFTSEVPPGSVVIDTRGTAEYRAWHWPGALRRDSEELARDFSALARNRCYVLYCGQGLKSARIAERMQAAGYESYSFLGGARRLRQQLAACVERRRTGEESGE